MQGTENFRRLKVEDAEEMARLERLCFSLPWSREQCRGALGQPAFAAFGIWQEKELVAYVSLYHTLPEMEILNVAVAPAKRRQGLARKLLHLVLQAAAKMGMQKATLEVRQSNNAAIGLYTGLGFIQCGKRPRYYPDNGEDALIHAFLFQ